VDADLKIVRPSFAVSNTDASFDVSVTDATFDVSYVKATYELASTTATFEVSSSAASFIVSYTNIIPTVIELGIFLLRHDAVDAAALTDFTSILYGKGLLEEVSGTELLTMATTKPVSDSAAFDDSIDRISSTKLLLDTGFVSELVSVSPAKGFFSPSVATDSLERQVDFSRGLSELAGATDLESFALAIGKNDFSYAIETISFANVFKRNYADVGSTADSTTIQLSKTLNDAAAWVDLLALAYATGKADSVSVFEAASLGHTRNVSDNGYVLESVVKSAITSKNDEASIGDAGSLQGQSYVDNLFYFAEDYVGFSRTF
jgi:hypothetical protein